MVYLDDTVIQSALGGIVLALAAVWAAWCVAWLRRIELRSGAEAAARELGLELSPEGLGPSLRARGALGGQPVEIRWRHGFGALKVRVRVAEEPWAEAPADAVAGWTRARLSARTPDVPG